MKLTVDTALQRAAEDFSDATIREVHNGGGMAPASWAYREGLERAFAQDPTVLAVFTAATKHLQTTSFAADLLEEWRDERAYYKKEDPSFTMADFMGEALDGYLERFTGRNLTQLVKYYLSPRAIDDGDWFHAATWTSEDGRYVAYGFTSFSFREHDGFLWFQEVATGRGVAVPHDEL